MNNAFVSEPEVTEKRAEVEATLIRKIEAIDGLLKGNEWRVLEELHFKPEESRVERLLLSESKKDSVNESELYRLQGELKWAKKYADLRTFGKLLKNQLDNIKNNG